MKLNKYILSYSLYGDNSRYFDALYENITFINSQYGDIFSISIVIGKNVPEKWVAKLDIPNVLIVGCDNSHLQNIHEDFYRVYPILSRKGEVCFFRDADSYLTKNEVDSMIRFINSDYTYHIVRDHPNHLAPIMGGLFGIKDSGYKLFKDIFLNNHNKYQFSDKSWRAHKTAARGEQIIWADYIYPFIYKDAYIESSFTIFWNERRFVSKCSIPKSNNHFMGQIDPKYNLDKNRDLEDYRQGTRRLYLPYWVFKLFRYRFLYRYSWHLDN